MRTGLLAPDCAATKKRVTKQAAGRRHNCPRTLVQARAPCEVHDIPVCAEPETDATRQSVWQTIGLEKLASSLAYSYPSRRIAPMPRFGTPYRQSNI